jgi:hypothetical protein
MMSVIKEACICYNSDLYEIGYSMGYQERELSKVFAKYEMYGSDGAGYFIISPKYVSSPFKDEILNKIMLEILKQSGNKEVYVLND